MLKLQTLKGIQYYYQSNRFKYNKNKKEIYLSVSFSIT